MAPTGARPDASRTDLRLLLVTPALLIFSFAVIDGATHDVRQDSTLSALKLFLWGVPGTDSWVPMRTAFDWLNLDLPGTVYQQVFFDQNIKFQYPPSSLLLLSGLSALGITPTDTLLNDVSWSALLITAAAVAWQAQLSLHKNATTSYTPIAVMMAMALAVIGTLTFYPVLKSYGLGQAQTWINACFALAIVCWLLDRRFLAGLLIGLICVIKPQFALFAFWGLLRGHRNFVAGMMTIGIPATAAAIAVFGLANHLDYLSVLQFLTRHGESYVANQSINGLLHRLNTGGYLEWRQGAFPPYVPFIHYATIAASASILATALFFKSRNETDSLLDFCTAALSFTLASPIAWDHHYGILPPIFLALFCRLAALPPSRVKFYLSVISGVAFLFAANAFPFAYDGDGPGSVIQSYLLIAALAVLAVLYMTRGQPNARLIGVGPKAL